MAHAVSNADVENFVLKVLLFGGQGLNFGFEVKGGGDVVLEFGLGLVLLVTNDLFLVLLLRNVLDHLLKLTAKRLLFIFKHVLIVSLILNFG